MTPALEQKRTVGFDRLSPCLTLCGAGHFAVDFACALTVVSLSALWRLADGDYYPMVIGYNLVAFGSQPFWGWLVDRSGRGRGGVTAGLFLTAIGVAAAGLQPVAAVLLLGCGNALFHVGAGSLVYLAAPGKAAGPGLFVAPGGVGLLAGIMIGLRGPVSLLWLPPLLCLFALALQRLLPEAPGASIPSGGERPTGTLIFPAVLLPFLVVVALRSFGGFALPVPWKGTSDGVLFLALAAFAGKASGGFLADRFGWRPFCGSMLILAAALGFGFRASLPAACAALYCLQTTTGVTLAGVQTLFPGRHAFAFGLPCIALLAGAFPFFLPQPLGLIRPALAVAVCLGAALAARLALPYHQTKEA